MPLARGLLLASTLGFPTLAMAAGADYSMYIAKNPVYCIDANGNAVTLRHGRATGSKDFTAILEGSRPTIVVEHDQLSRHPDWFQAFLFYRECGFHRQGVVRATKPFPPPAYDKQHINASDCFAIQAVSSWSRGTGVSLSSLPSLIVDRMRQQTSAPAYATSPGQLRDCLSKAKAR